MINISKVSLNQVTSNNKHILSHGISSFNSANGSSLLCRVISTASGSSRLGRSRGQKIPNETYRNIIFERDLKLLLDMSQESMVIESLLDNKDNFEKEWTLRLNT